MSYRCCDSCPDNQEKYSPIRAGETLRLLDRITGELEDGRYKVLGVRRDGARPTLPYLPQYTVSQLTVTATGFPRL